MLDHSCWIWSWLKPFLLRRSNTSSFLRVLLLTSLCLSLLMTTTSIFWLEGDVVSMVLTSALMATFEPLTIYIVINLIKIQILLILLLQEGVGCQVVLPYGSGLPSSIVTRGIGAVELELVVLVVAGKEEGGSEGSLSSWLCVTLLEVADSDDQLLDGNALLVLEPVLLSNNARIIDQVIGIGSPSRYDTKYMLIYGVDLLWGLTLLQEMRHLLLLSSKDHTLR